MNVTQWRIYEHSQTIARIHRDISILIKCIEEYPQGKEYYEEEIKKLHEQIESEEKSHKKALARDEEDFKRQLRINDLLPENWEGTEEQWFERRPDLVKYIDNWA